MAVVDDVLARVNDLTVNVGTATLSAMFPAEFQYNIISIELTDSDGNTLDFFSFPINPASLAYQEPEVTNVKKTFGGVTAITNNTFVPKSLAINGTFGRNYKFLTSRLDSGDIASWASFGASVVNLFSTPKTSNYRYNNGLAQREFSKTVKSGYGCIKLLQYFIDAAGDLDKNGRPNMLFFHNNAFGESWLVKPLRKTFTIVESRNIYDYNIQFAVVAPARLVSQSPEKNEKSIIRALSKPILQKNVNKVVKDIGKILKR